MNSLIVIFLVYNFLNIYIDIKGSPKAKEIINKLNLLPVLPFIALTKIFTKKNSSKYRIIVNKNRD